MQQKRSYEYISNDGDTVTAKTLATRLTEFRAAFPFKEGYALTTSNEISRIQLRNLTGHELPAIQFTAELRYRGELVASASTLQPIEGYKSFETGESNARSRLIELMGFGREMTDQDEALQLAEFDAHAGNKSAILASVSPIPITIPVVQTESSPVTVEAVPTDVTPSAITEIHTDSGKGRRDSFAKVKAVPHRAAERADDNAIPEYLRTQIEQRYLRMGTPSPEYTTEAQAKEILQKLLKANSSP